jgi:predicted site-specific integrase-resolvase
MNDADVQQLADLDRQIRELRQQVLSLTETMSVAIGLLDERTSTLRLWLRRLEQARVMDRVDDDDDRPAA